MGITPVLVLTPVFHASARLPATLVTTVTNNGVTVTATAERDDAVDRIQKEFPTAAFPVLTAPQGNVLDEAAKALE